MILERFLAGLRRELSTLFPQVNCGRLRGCWRGISSGFRGNYDRRLLLDESDIYSWQILGTCHESRLGGGLLVLAKAGADGEDLLAVRVDG